MALKQCRGCKSKLRSRCVSCGVRCTTFTKGGRCAACAATRRPENDPQPNAVPAFQGGHVCVRCAEPIVARAAKAGAIVDRADEVGLFADDLGRHRGADPHDRPQPARGEYSSRYQPPMGRLAN